MHVDFAFICDHAEVGGRINALGIGFDTIYARQVPARHPYFYLVAQIRASVAEVGEKDLEVHLIDEDGKEITPVVKAKFNIPKPREGSTETLGRIRVGFVNVEFPSYSRYSIRAAVQGHEMIQIPLRLSPTPNIN